MRCGIMYDSGDVVLTQIQFSDKPEIKLRPALVLFEELNNVVVAGITSNKKMIGVPLTREDGAVRKSIIKLNYIFTISCSQISRRLFSLNHKKRKLVYKELKKKIKRLKK